MANKSVTSLLCVIFSIIFLVLGAIGAVYAADRIPDILGMEVKAVVVIVILSFGVFFFLVLLGISVLIDKTENAVDDTQGIIRGVNKIYKAVKNPEVKEDDEPNEELLRLDKMLADGVIKQEEYDILIKNIED